ncbi:MAG TPA: GYD domain-containing protein [Chthoniobacteraceae bacterium]|nr:GYD domain-containing protein [Chthoniobacteraceae bacterium]
MTKYLVLLRFTEQGIKGIKDSASRAHAFKEEAERSGVTVEGQYWTVGAYDGALILSSDDESKVLKTLTGLASKGNVHTETLRAFDEREFSAFSKG